MDLEKSGQCHLGRIPSWGRCRLGVGVLIYRADGSFRVICGDGLDIFQEHNLVVEKELVFKCLQVR